MVSIQCTGSSSAATLGGNSICRHVQSNQAAPVRCVSPTPQEKKPEHRGDERCGQELHATPTPRLYSSCGLQAKESRSAKPGTLEGGQPRALEARTGLLCRGHRGWSLAAGDSCQGAQEGSRKPAVACTQAYVSSLEDLLFSLKGKKATCSSWYQRQRLK